VASLNRTVQIYPRGFHHGKSRTLVTRTPEFAIPDFPKWVISRHVASVIRTVQIYFGAFAPIHWGFNPRVTPDRSNGCRVFQPRSDGSDWFLPVHSSTTPGRGKINGPDTPMDLGDLRSRFLRYPRRHRKQRGKAFNTLLTPTNLTVMRDHRFPDGISSVDQYLSGLRHLTLHLLLPI
jgi:hypothetical protein